jgi:hypothetical protein
MYKLYVKITEADHCFFQKKRTDLRFCTRSCTNLQLYVKITEAEMYFSKKMITSCFTNPLQNVYCLFVQLLHDHLKASTINITKNIEPGL